MEVKILEQGEAFRFFGLTLSKFRAHLLRCEAENVVAVGAFENEIPCGLAVAFADKIREKTDPIWKLESLFVKSNYRRRGAGRKMWDLVSGELESRGCKRLVFQGVLREEAGELLSRFFLKLEESTVEKITEIYRFDQSNIMKSPFVKGAKAGVFQPPARFLLISWKNLNEEYRKELEANEGGWYPEFVSPRIGQESINEKCTVFAVDTEQKKIAGWVTVLNVNNGKNLLYRTFFTRVDYRMTQVGFHIFVEAVKNHLDYYMERGGLSSVPLDNHRALRFSRLFFRGAYQHISYEYRIQMGIMERDEPFLKEWQGVEEQRLPCFPGVDLNAYESLEVFIHDTGAGNLPVLYVKDREQFEDILCRIFYKGEKRALPQSMGAMMIKGWRDVWGRAHRVLLLSDGFYSGIPPEAMGLSACQWKEKSHQIRLAHESAHYYALRIYGFMNTGLMDEFIADTAGIVAAFETYEAAQFLRFMGIEEYPTYRRGGRLENYLPKGFKEEREDWLSSPEFSKMQSEAYEMAVGMEKRLKNSQMDLHLSAVRTQLLDMLCRDVFFMLA